MPPVGFEPTISGGERPQTYSLDGVATGIQDTSQSLIFLVIQSELQRRDDGKQSVTSSFLQNVPFEDLHLGTYVHVQVQTVYSARVNHIKNIFQTFCY